MFKMLGKMLANVARAIVTTVKVLNSYRPAHKNAVYNGGAVKGKGRWSHHWHSTFRPKDYKSPYELEKELDADRENKQSMAVTVPDDVKVAQSPQRVEVDRRMTQTTQPAMTNGMKPSM